MQQHCALPFASVTRSKIRLFLLLPQGFVDKPSDCDISAVLGMGFPAWRGGPLKHGDAVGAKTVLAKLQVSLSPLHGRPAAA